MHNYQLLDEVEQRSIICLADQFARHRQIVIFCEISSNNCFIIHLQSITLSFVKLNELYTQNLFLQKLPDYIVLVDFPCLQILPKDTDGRFSSFFVFSEFFPVVNKTTRLLVVQENEPQLFTKVEAMRMLRLLFARSYLQINLQIILNF